MEIILAHVGNCPAGGAGWGGVGQGSTCPVQVRTLSTYGETRVCVWSSSLETCIPEVHDRGDGCSLDCCLELYPNSQAKASLAQNILFRADKAILLRPVRTASKATYTLKPSLITKTEFTSVKNTLRQAADVGGSPL